MYKVRFYCIDGAHYVYLEQETVDENVTCPTHPESDIRDFVIVEDMNDLKDAVTKRHTQDTDAALRADKFTVDADGKAHINTSLAEALKIGNGAAGVDYYMLFDGNATDGKIIWQTVKNKFKFDCGLEVESIEAFLHMHTDELLEYTEHAGVTIDGVLIKDGEIDTDLLAKKHDHANKAELDLVTDGDHDVRTDNPHNVTAEQIGYGMTYVEDETVSSTTNTAWQQKLRMNFTPSATGDYLLEWSIEITNSKSGSNTYVQIELDDATQINHTVKEPGIAGEYVNYSGFKKVNFADTDLHTIDVDFKAESDTASIRRVRLSIIKI